MSFYLLYSARQFFSHSVTDQIFLRNGSVRVIAFMARSVTETNAAGFKAFLFKQPLKRSDKYNRYTRSVNVCHGAAPVVF